MSAKPAQHTEQRANRGDAARSFTFSLTQTAWPLYVTYPLAWCIVSYAIAGRFEVTGEFLAYAAIVPACQTVMIWIALRLGRRFFQP